MIYALEAADGSRVYLAGDPALTQLQHTWASDDSMSIDTVQVVHTGGFWANAIPRDFGNKQVSFTFKTHRLFSTLLEAQIFRCTTLPAMPTSGILVRMYPSETAGYYKTWRAPNATIKVNVLPGGCTVELQYSVQCGEFLPGDEEGPTRVLDVGDGRILQDGSGNELSP